MTRAGGKSNPHREMASAVPQYSTGTRSAPSSRSTSDTSCRNSRHRGQLPVTTTTAVGVEPVAAVFSRVAASRLGAPNRSGCDEVDMVR